VVVGTVSDPSSPEPCPLESGESSVSSCPEPDEPSFEPDVSSDTDDPDVWLEPE
jgi:hypothetical protein